MIPIVGDQIKQRFDVQWMFMFMHRLTIYTAFNIPSTFVYVYFGLIYIGLIDWNLGSEHVLFKFRSYIYYHTDSLILSQAVRESSLEIERGRRNQWLYLNS